MRIGARRRRGSGVGTFRGGQGTLDSSAGGSLRRSELDVGGGGCNLVWDLGRMDNRHWTTLTRRRSDGGVTWEDPSRRVS